MIRVYIDAEFDAVKYQKKFEQAVISIGAIACDEQRVIDDFYTLVCPKYFKRLSPVIKRITKLRNEDILSSDSLHVVSLRFQKWLESIGSIEDMKFYSCGPDDRRTLMRNCDIHEIDGHIYDRIEDLQKVISATIKFQNQIVSPALSLDDMKAVYDVDGIVEHNALTDAIDLMHIHMKYLDQYPQNQKKIIEIVNRKEQKRIESRKKQIERLRLFIKKQFASYPKGFVEIPLWPEIIKEFQEWEEREQYTFLHWRKEHYIHENTIYSYKMIRIWMKVDMEDEIPSVHVRFVHQNDEFMKKYPLSYRNATMIEKIYRRVLA